MRKAIRQLTANPSPDSKVEQNHADQRGPNDLIVAKGRLQQTRGAQFHTKRHRAGRKDKNGKIFHKNQLKSIFATVDQRIHINAH
jgi:hypothetical protein